VAFGSAVIFAEVVRRSSDANAPRHKNYEIYDGGYPVHFRSLIGQ
jgi:hypothetical protein